MANPQEAWTIRKLLEWTENYFKTKIQGNARLETQILLSHVLNCKRIELYTRSDEMPSEEQRAKFKELIKKRVEGTPVAYLVGFREFYSLGFEVSSAVLIPRPETEFLIVEASKLLKVKPDARVLDLGTGSGNIAISLTHQHKSIRTVSIDISPEALEIAKRNSIKHGVTDRITFLEGNLYSPLSPEDQFDLIVSNPPYVTQAEWESLAPDVKNFEPRLALIGGVDGLDFYRLIITGAKKFLQPGGSLLLEIGSTQESSVKEILVGNGFDEIRMVEDGAKLPRILVAN